MITFTLTNLNSRKNPCSFKQKTVSERFNTKNEQSMHKNHVLFCDQLPHNNLEF